MKTEQQYCTLVAENKTIRINGIFTSTLAQLQADFPNSNWAILPLDELPENWHEMTIVDKKLVPATPEVIAERQALKLTADTESVRVARESRYKSDTDPLMVSVIEEFAKANPDNEACKAWLSAKETVKAELPKPCNQIPQIPQNLQNSQEDTML